MSTLSKEYGRLRAELEERLNEKGYDSGDLLTEVNDASISILQAQLARVRDYLMQTERLAYQIVNLNRTIGRNEYYIKELEEILDTRIESLDEFDSVDMAQQAQIQEDRFLSIIAEANGLKLRDLRRKFDRGDGGWETLEGYYNTLVENTNSLREQHDSTVLELHEVRIEAGIEPISPETEEVLPEEEVDVEAVPTGIEEPGDDGISEEMEPRDPEGVAPENSGEMEEAEDVATTQIARDIEEINNARALADMVAQRKARWDKVSELKGVKLTPGKEFRDNRSQIKKIQEKINADDAFLRDYVYEFSKNPNYEKSEELIKLIGIRDEKRDEREGTSGSVLVKPTIKRHLEPILEIEEKLKDDTLTKEEKEKLKQEKAKKVRRLGTKWLLKLKIDKLTADIDKKKAELELLKQNPAQNKDRIEALVSELGSLQSDLANLKIEYGEALEQIAQIISSEVEKKVLERNGVNSLEELQEKGNKKSNERSEEAGKREPGVRDETGRENGENIAPTVNGERVVGGEREEADTVTPTRAGNGSVAQGQVGSVGGARAESVSSNVPAKKPSLKERITNMFKKKEKEEDEERVTDWENGGTVLKSEDIEYDFSLQYASMPPSKVEGEYFYFTREREGKIEYVQMPLKDIVCNKKALLEEIKRLQEEHKGRDYVRPGEIDDRGLMERLDGRSGEDILAEQNSPAEDFRLKKPRAIANHILGMSRGKERDLRMLSAICQLRAAHLTKEVDEAMYGCADYQFIPGVQLDGKQMTFVPLDHTSDEFKKVVGKLNRDTPMLNGLVHKRQEPDYFMSGIEDFGEDFEEDIAEDFEEIFDEEVSGRRRRGLRDFFRRKPRGEERVFNDEYSDDDLYIPEEDEAIYTPRRRGRYATLEYEDDDLYIPEEDEPIYTPRRRERRVRTPRYAEYDEPLDPVSDSEEVIQIPEDETLPIPDEPIEQVDTGVSERGKQVRRELAGENYENLNYGRQTPPGRPSTLVPKREGPSRRSGRTIPAPEWHNGPTFDGEYGAPNLNGKAPVLTGTNITGGNRRRMIDRQVKKQENTQER